MRNTLARPLAPLSLQNEKSYNSGGVPSVILCFDFKNRCMSGKQIRLASTTPAASQVPAVDDEDLAEVAQQLRDLLDDAGGSAVALTGAGMSTDSGIPDYRGPQGSYSRGHKPMTHDEFLSSESNRKRCVCTWADKVYAGDAG